MRQGNDKFLQPGARKPAAKPILSIKAKKQIAAKEPKPTMQQMLKKNPTTKPMPAGSNKKVKMIQPPKPGVNKNPNKFKVI